MNNQEFSSREALEQAFRRWWVIVLLTVLGGIAGWSFHFFRPPLYEATAVVTVNMNFQKVKLTQYEEDYAFNAAGAIAASTEVKNQIVAASQTHEVSITSDQLQQQMFLERKQSVWEFHIRNQNPEIAAELANLWVEKTGVAVNTALGHALKADQIQDQISSITSSAGSAGLGTDAQVTIKGLSDDLLQEQKLSKGLLSIMKFTLSESATVPSKPDLYYLADLVLAGACIGFVVSVWVVNVYKGRRRA